MSNNYENTVFEDVKDGIVENYMSSRDCATICQVFQEQADKTPDNIAVSFESHDLTYNELNEKSNQLARYIRMKYSEENGKSLVSDTLIGIFMDRSLEMIVGLLAIQKAGGAYVPIDPHTPNKRILYFLEDTQCQIVLTQTHLVERFYDVVDVSEPDESIKNLDYPRLITVDDEPYISEDCKSLLNMNVPTDLAYVLYTSGTTGKPKGVMVEHHSVLNLSYSRRKDFLINESSVVLQFSPLTFDASVCEIFSALINGAKLQIISEHEKRDPGLLIDYLRLKKVTVATILPTLLAQVSIAQQPKLPDLKTLIVAGEPCPKDVIVMWRKGRRLINAYGPTEATVCATVHLYKDGDNPSVIGLPLENVSVCILDDELKPLPAGEIGELFIGGVGLARGYLNKAELTKQRFIDDPRVSGQSRYNRLYKTGDLARMMDDGNIEYIGRNDNQVKIRGHRIEIGELEHALLSYPGIKQVCVLAKDRLLKDNNNNKTAGANNSATKYLVVYYMSDNQIDSDEFVKHLSQSLPSYMIPGYYVRLDKFPLTGNGKIDRKVLPEPVFRNEKFDYIAPRTKLERELCSIWQSVLVMDKIGINDDFFDVGGNSLLVISLAGLINENYGIKINVSTLFSHRTVASQAEYMQDISRSLNNYQPISAFRPNGTKPALFFVHPSLTGAELYIKMVNCLDCDQPFYGVESYNVNHLDSPETDLYSLAKRYVTYIKDVQPCGPYYLGGYSLGGNIAYEIAHQLINSGETVSGLYLIDSVLPCPTAMKNGVTYQDAKNFLEYFEFEDTSDTRLLELAKLEMNLLFNYLPKSKLPVKLVLIKATKLLSPLEYLDEEHIANHFFQLDRPYSGWELYAKEVDRYDIDANHETIVKPKNLEAVAKIIQKDMNIPEALEMYGFWS